MKKLIRFVGRGTSPDGISSGWCVLCTPVLGLAYAGRGVECPVCGAR